MCYRGRIAPRISLNFGVVYTSRRLRDRKRRLIVERDERDEIVDTNATVHMFLLCPAFCDGHWVGFSGRGTFGLLGLEDAPSDWTFRRLDDIPFCFGSLTVVMKYGCTTCNFGVFAVLWNERIG